MLGIDANIVVRLLTLDPPDQAKRARALIAENDVYVSLTVMLETEWVLRDVYELGRVEIAEALARFSDLERVEVESPQTLKRALGWMKSGLDFADALHLAHGEAFDAFATFDKRLVKRAQALDGVTARLI